MMCLPMTKIFLDAGHGGSDSGAVGNGLREKDLTLDIAKRIRKYLNDNYTGYAIKLSRTSDVYLSLSQRTNMANAWKADLFVSIHINAGGGTGYEDFIYNGSTSSKTRSSQDIIHTEIMRNIDNVRDRGKKKANFAVLRLSNMPALLTENLFIDTKADADKLKQSSFLDAIAKGHGDGIAKFFGLKLKGENIKVNNTTSKPVATKPKNQSRPVLRLGSKGDHVRDAQSRLVQKGYSVGRYGVDGHFGNDTYKAVTNLQRDSKKSVDGIIGAVTWGVLYSDFTKPTSNTKPVILKVGSKVKIKNSASKYTTGQNIPSKYKNKSYTIMQVKSDRVLLKEIMSWVFSKDVY